MHALMGTKSSLILSKDKVGPCGSLHGDMTTLGGCVATLSWVRQCLFKMMLSGLGSHDTWCRVLLATPTRQKLLSQVL